LWNRFIDEVMMGDKEKTEYLQKAIGYGITADTIQSMKKIEMEMKPTEYITLKVSY